MTMSNSSRFLRWVLLADAVASGATGLLMALLAGVLADLLLVPAILLFIAGFILIPYAGFVGYLGTRDRLSPRAVWVVIGCNSLWAVNCVVIAFSGWIEPSVVGYAFILAQAFIVAAFAELQYVGLRRSPSAA